MSEVSRGMFFMFLSTISFAVMNSVVKILNSNGFSSMEAVFARSLSMLIVILFVFLANRKSFKSKKEGGFKKILIRSFFGAFSMSLLFYNFATIPLGIAVAFTQMVPIYATIFALFTKSKPSVFVTFSALIGFIGVLFISKSNVEIPLINIIVGIVGGISATFAFITINSLREYYSSNVVVLYYAIFLSFIGLFGMFVPLEGVGGFKIPDIYDYVLIILIGILSTMSQSFMTKAYMFAKAYMVSPIGYLRIVWSVMLGIVLGDAMPDFEGGFGIILIIISGLFVSLPVILKDRQKNF